MAAGDILSVVIGAEGWYADITVAGLATGGTYAFGLGTNDNPATGTPKITFTVVSLGYDDTGAATTITRTVYGTKQLRKPYPNQAQNQETVVGSDVKIRVALSDYIFAKDKAGGGNSGTDVVVNILGGFYTKTAVPNNATGASFAVTNSSTAAYPKVVGNWSWPGYELMNSSSKLRCVAFHMSGQSGRPVRAVKFSVNDGTTTNTQTLTAPVYDSSVGDAVPVVEYVSTNDLTAGLTQGTVLTINFIAYPWIGDSAAILDTSAGTAAPSPLYGPIKGVCDRTGAYGVTKVLVNSSTGNDGTGVAYDSAVFNELTATPCATINGALVKARAYNNANHGRDDISGVVIVLAAGNHAWTGASGATGATPDAWPTITKAAAAARAAVIITAASGNQATSARSKLVDVTITTAGVSVFDSATAVWLDQCTLNCTDVATVYQATTWWVTRCTVNSLTSGLRPFSTETSPLCILRGSTLAGFSGAIFAYTMLGNTKTDVSASTVQIFGSYVGQTVPTANNQIIAYNSLLGLTVASASIWNPTPTTHGHAFVQNVLENYDNTSSPLAQFAADGALAGEDFYHFICWNNGTFGQRFNRAYNDTAANAPVRLYWSWKNNIEHDDNIKTDTFPAENAARVNNWSQLYGVSYSGNLLGDSGSGFAPEFNGISTLYHTWTNDFAAYILCVDYKAWIGSGADGAGLGDYQLQAGSPAEDLPIDLLIPFDIEGRARRTGAPAGAFAPASSNTGGFFF